MEPNNFPYHMFLYPNMNCFAGRANVGCFGQDGGPCRAEVSYPYVTDFGTVAHEIGWVLLDHQSVFTAISACCS